MNIFSAKEKSEHFEKKVQELLGKEQPEFVWVDNLSQNHRFWKLYAAYCKNGKIQKEAFFFMGEYSLFLEKGCTITEGQDGWKIEGLLVFGHESKSTALQEAWINRDGVFSFSITEEDMAVWGADIRYVCEKYDEYLEKNLFLNLCFSVFRCKTPQQFSVSFFPAAIGKNCFLLEQDAVTESFLRTRYGKRIELLLPKGFSFVLATSVDVNGYKMYYFTPSGTAAVTEEQLCMPGLTGTEYVQLKDSVLFLPGQQAYFGKTETEDVCTTSYLAFPNGIYYSQPQNMGFYNDSTESVYPYAALPGILLQNAAVPILPFGGLIGDSEKAVELETKSLAGIRKKYIEKAINQNLLKKEITSYAFTRSGMYTAYNTSQLLWLQLIALRGLQPGLGFTNIQPKLWFALLSSELFLALTDLKEMAQIPYSVTTAFLERAKKKDYPDTEKLQKLIGKTFLSQEECKSEIENVGAVWNGIIQDACCHFNANLAGWEFTCAPYHWDKYQTLFLVKLSERNAIKKYMENPALWSLDLSEEEVMEAGQRFSNISNLAANSSLEYLQKMLGEPSWKGCVFFRAGVDVETLPKELSFLVNGICKENFYAAYVSFPFIRNKEQDNALGSAFIYYENKKNLEFESYQDYGFQVRELRLDIRENKIRDFQVKAELLINRLFEFKTTGRAETGESCSLVFHGSYQENESGGYYGFVMQEPVEYYVDAGGITRICIETATLQTAGDNSRFVLGGYMALNSGFEMDMFSFEKLPFEGLGIEMKTEGEDYAFQVDYSSFILKPENGSLREDSFGKRFPAYLSHMIIRGKRKITEDGFLLLKLKDYGDEEDLGEDWTGFVWKVETGNLGSLAEATKLTLELLVAFRPDADNPRGNPAACCGIRISSMVTAESFSLPLQGIVSLGFDAIELRKEEDYYFCFRNFSFTILGKRFPESNNDLYLVGDENGNLGWYGAVES